MTDNKPDFVVTAHNPREAILRVMALGTADPAKAEAYTEAADRAATAPDAEPSTPDDGEFTICTYGEDQAPGAGCILPAGHQPAERHLVLPGDEDGGTA